MDQLADGDFKGLLQKVYNENDGWSKGEPTDEVERILEDEEDSVSVSGDEQDWDELIKAILDLQTEEDDRAEAVAAKIEFVEEEGLKPD